MKRTLTALTFVVLNTFALTACSSAPTKEGAAPTEAPKTALSEAAQQALSKAEADVKTAKAKFALWTTAESALQAAHEAAKAGDSEVVIKQAKFASDQVAHGIAQLSYPTTELK